MSLANKSQQERKGFKMKSLNTQDFLESHKALRLAKYPALNDVSHAVLAALLAVSIEWEKSFDEIQAVLDQKTKEQKLELELFQNEKVGA